MTDKRFEAGSYEQAPPPYAAGPPQGYPMADKQGPYPPQQAGGPSYPPQQGGGPSYPPQQGGGDGSYVYTQQPVAAQVVYVTAPRQPAPPDSMMYAVFVTLCCCWPIGIFAILRSMDSRRLYNQGDMDAARSMGQRARQLSHWALGVGIVVVVLSLIAVGLYLGLYVFPIIFGYDD